MPLRTLGYEAVWQGERSWNGVAILARNHAPVLTSASLPGNPQSPQARYIEAAVQAVLIHLPPQRESAAWTAKAKPLRVCWLKAGPTRCGGCIRTGRPGHMNGGRKTKAMRLDHFLLSPKMSDRLVDGGADRWVRGQANASDRAPTRIMLDL